MKPIKMIKRGARRHGATILTVIAGIGVAVTAYLAAKAGPDAVSAFEKAKEDNVTDEAEQKGEEVNYDDVKKVKLSIGEILKIGIPVYKKAIIAGAITIVCLVTSRVISAQELMGMTSLYSAANTMHQKYVEKTKDVVGEEKELEIRKEVHKAMAEEREKYAENGSGFRGGNRRIIETGLGDDPFYDVWSDRWFLCSQAAIRAAVDSLQDDLDRGNTNNALYGDNVASLSDLYERINLDATKAGDNLIWDRNEDNNCIILCPFTECRTLNGRAYAVMDFSVPPRGQQYRYY